MYLFSLSNTKNLAEQICSKTKLKLGQHQAYRLSDGELYLAIKNKIKGQNVFVMGSTYQPDNNIIEFLILINALKENGAKKITAIIPYFGYARQDKIDRAGSPITAKLIADLFKTAGINQFITIDIHSQRNEKYLGPKLINISCLSLFADYIKKNIDLRNCLIVAPDKGAKPRALTLSKLLGKLPIIIMQKIRIKQNIAKVMRFKKAIAGKNALIIDDMIDTAGTIISACQELQRHQVKNIYVFATHGILSGPAISRIKKAPIKQIVLTDSYPLPKNKKIGKIKILPINPLLIKYLH